jgi:Putative adhesin
MSYSVARAGGLRMTPGRVTALVIGVPIVLALIAFTGLNFVADLGQASFPVSDSFPVNNGQVTAQIAGDITLRQGPVSAAQLTGTAHYSLFRPTVTKSGSTVSFDCRFHFGNCSLDGTLEVPENTAVSLSTSGGDVSLGNYAGDLTLRSDGGNVTAGHLTGHLLSLSTSGGDVNIGTLNGTGPVRLTTEGGNITGQAIAAPAVTAQTAGGDVSLTFIQAPSSLTITGEGGNITLVLPRGATRYRFNVSTDGGNVTNTVPNDPNASDTIYVHTAGGDINITEAS